MGSLKIAGYQPGSGIIKRAQDIFSPDKGVDSLKPSASELGVGEIAYIRRKKYLVVEAERKANCLGCDLLKGGGYARRGANILAPLIQGQIRLG